MAISTTTRKTTTRKAKTSKKASVADKKPVTGLARKPASTLASKPASTLAPTLAAKAAVDPAGSTSPVVTPAELKKKELIDLVVARSGIKKKDAKPVVEAMLGVLGETIAEGRELNLQPLGKLRINRTVEKPNGRIFICKLRQSLRANATPGKDASTGSGAGSSFGSSTGPRVGTGGVAKDDVAETLDKL